ncbi:MAG: glycosyltransferase family 2 protein [Deinococcales bacterium]
MIKNVLAVIVTYNPTENLLDILENIAQSVEDIIIVDNNSASDTVLADAQSRYRFTLFKNKTNLGVAKALETAANFAVENGFSWLLTLDQDSVPEQQFAQKLAFVLQKYPNPEKIAIISPVHQEKNSKKIFEPDFFYKKIASNMHQNWIEMPWILTSGNLVRVSVFSHMIQFDSDLFIDGVDTDFCFKCIDQGYKIVVVPSVIMQHSVGYQVKGFFKQRPASVHHPIRNYYQFRNRLLLWKRHFKKHFAWVLRDFVYGTKKFFDNVFFADQKLLRLKLIFWGIWHGLLGKTGSYL